MGIGGADLSGGENRAAGWQLGGSGEWVMRFSIQTSVHHQTPSPPISPRRTHALPARQ